MLAIPVYDSQGKPAGEVEIDPEVLGGEVRAPLLKQAVVMYQANRRQNTVATRSRGMVEGSTRKLYRQKGTGNARMGTRRTNIRRGGGMAFRKGEQNYTKGMNKKMRRLARNNAILAKITSQDALVLESLEMEAPNTKRLARLMRSVGAERGAVLALDQADRAVVLSGRNIPKTEVRPLADLNAYDILRRRKLIMTKAAFDVLARDPERLRAESAEAGVS
jgi:large subunit ribosomal protein L4